MLSKKKLESHYNLSWRVPDLILKWKENYDSQNPEALKRLKVEFSEKVHSTHQYWGFFFLLNIYSKFDL